MTFTLLDTLGCFEVKKWWYKKTILYLLEDMNLFKILKKKILLSDQVLVSKWPWFVVPIHSGNPV